VTLGVLPFVLLRRLELRAQRAQVAHLVRETREQKKGERQSHDHEHLGFGEKPDFGEMTAQYRRQHRYQRYHRQHDHDRDQRPVHIRAAVDACVNAAHGCGA
jgi:hypothetical protein